MLKTRLKDWRQWGLKIEPQVVKVFATGKNHQAAHIRSGKHDLVVKVFSHSFDQSISVQCWAATLGITPNIIFAQDSLAVMEYICAEPSKDLLGGLASALYTLHSADASQLRKLPLQTFDLLTYCEDYLANASPRCYSEHLALKPALDIFLKDPTPWVACHNDLVQENCISTSDRVWFIDWEYAMQHNPWFDLGAIILYFELSHAKAETLLARYRPGWEKYVNEPIYYASQIAVLWSDLCWHMHKYGNDYRKQQCHRFEKLATLAAELSVELPSQTE